MRLLHLLQDAQATHPDTPVSLSKMAQVLGVTRERVRFLYQKLAVDHQLPPVKKRGGWSEKRMLEHKGKDLAVAQKVKALREKGMHSTQIKHELGISRVRVDRAIAFLKRRGETARKLPPIQTLAFEEEVRTYRAQGMSYHEIARKIGRLPKSVYTVLRRLDIPLSKRTRPQHIKKGRASVGRKPEKQP